MKNKYACPRALGRGLSTSISAMLLSSMTSFVIKAGVVSGNSMLQDVESFLIAIFCSAVCVLIFNSFSLAFAYSDTVKVEEFLVRDNKEVHFGSEMKLIFKSPLSYIEFTGLILPVIIAASAGGFPSLSQMIKGGAPLGIFFPMLLLTPIIFIIFIFSKYEAARYFRKLERENNIEKLMSPKWLICRMLLLGFLYFFVTPLAPLLIFAVITLFGAFAQISRIFTVIGTVAVIAALMALIWLIRALAGIRGRKSFLKRLKEIAEKENITLSSVHDPYRSFFTSRDQCKFTLTDGDKIYDCIVISTLSKRVPLIFTSPTDAHFLHRIGTDNHNFSLRHGIEFYHTDEGEKIIIIDPTPKSVYVTEDGMRKKLYCADTIWSITVHDPLSFLGCVERHCLDGRESFRDE